MNRKHIGLPSDLKGKSCVKCGTDNLLDANWDAWCDTLGVNFICPKCLHNGDKTWKFKVSPHPDGDFAHMLTDDFADITSYVENWDPEHNEGEDVIEVNWGYESIDSYIERILKDKEVRDDMLNVTLGLLSSSKTIEPDIQKTINENFERLKSGYYSSDKDKEANDG